MVAYHGTSSETFAGEIFEKIGDRRKHLFDIYIEHMFQRTARTKNEIYTVEWTKNCLAWLGSNMKIHRKAIFLHQELDWKWLQEAHKKILYYVFCGLSVGLPFGLLIGLFANPTFGILCGLLSTIFWVTSSLSETITPWNRNPSFGFLAIGLLIGCLFFGYFLTVTEGSYLGILGAILGGLVGTLVIGASLGTLGLIIGIPWAFSLIFDFEYYGLYDFIIRFIKALILAPVLGLVRGISTGFTIGMSMSFMKVIHYYFFRFILSLYGNFPWNYTSFLDFAVERILLRRVGGGYIFLHRLLMEHFAEMYQENE